MKYRRLPGKKSGFFRKCTVYLGEDHFLSVESNIYTEEYFRFYFADIQAFISKRTDRGRIWSIVLGFFSLIFATCTINASAPPAGPGAIIYGGVAALAIVLLFYNLWLGPTCVTYVKTAVTVHELPALERAKRREKFLVSIRPLIVKAQGTVDLNRVREIQVPGPAAHSDAVAGFPSSAEGPENVPAAIPVRGRAGAAHVIMFSTLLVSAGVNALWVFSSSLPVLLTSIILSMVMFALVIVALVVQSQRMPSADIRRYTWIAMIGFLVFAVLAYISMMVSMFRNIASGPVTPWEFYSTIASSGVTDMPLLAGVILVSSVFYCIIGVLGVVAILVERRTGAGLQEAKVITGVRRNR